MAADPYWQTVDPRSKAFVDLLPSSHSYPVTRQVNILTSALTDAYNAVLKGQQTAAQALQQANQLVNEAIKENRV